MRLRRWEKAALAMVAAAELAACGSIGNPAPKLCPPGDFKKYSFDAKRPRKLPTQAQGYMLANDAVGLNGCGLNWLDVETVLFKESDDGTDAGALDPDKYGSVGAGEFVPKTWHDQTGLPLKDRLNATKSVQAIVKYLCHLLPSGWGDESKRVIGWSRYQAGPNTNSPTAYGNEAEAHYEKVAKNPAKYIPEEINCDRSRSMPAPAPRVPATSTALAL